MTTFRVQDGYGSTLWDGIVCDDAIKWCQENNESVIEVWQGTDIVGYIFVKSKK